METNWPANPQIGDTFTVGRVARVWDGTAWVSEASTVVGPQGLSAFEVAVANGFTGTEQEWLDSLGGSSADIADFVFTSEEGQSKISLPSDRQMRIEAGEDSDLYLDAGDDLYLTTLEDDIHIRAGDDIRFTASYDGDEGIEHYWRMDSEGRFQLPGDGYISNPYQETTTPLTQTIEFTNNYLNEPTALNQAEAVFLPIDSNTAWFLDNSNNFTSPVTITFADSTVVELVAIYDASSQQLPAVVFQWVGQINKAYEDAFPLFVSVDYNQINSGPSVIVLDPVQWDGSDQHIVIDATAPNHIHIRAGGEIDQSTADLIIGGENTYVKVSDISGNVDINAADVTISSQSVPSALNINTFTGAIVNSARTSGYTPEDKIVATLGDISNVVTAEIPFTVNGGTLGDQPTFTGDPLFTGSYVKAGPIVHFQIQVDMDNITNFGTGQYYVDLPFDAKYGYQFKEGCLHDISASKQYALGGHVVAGTSRLFLTYTSSNGQDEFFTSNNPVGLNAADNFHISGTYIV